MLDFHNDEQSLELRAKLVAQLVKSGDLKSPAVERSFLKVPRELFVPKNGVTEELTTIYQNNPLTIKTDGRLGEVISTSSQPSVMASMLQLLEPCEGKKILEIGTGTGYNAALLASLVGSSGKVVSVELDPDLAELARKNLCTLGLDNRTLVITGDGWEGYSEEAPYDGIIVTAQSDDIAPAWFEQLTADGRLILPMYLAPEFQFSTIVGFRRQGVLLKSFNLVQGRFIGLRGYHTVHGPEISRYGILVNLGAATDGEHIVQIESALLPEINLARRADLLSLWLAPGLIATLSEKIPSFFDFANFLRLKKSKDGVCKVIVNPQHAIQNLGRTRIQGVGLVHFEGDQPSLLLLSWPTSAHDETRDSVILYGANPKVLMVRFENIIKEWKDLGYVGLKDLRVTANQGNWTGELGHGSWVLPLRSATLVLDYEVRVGDAV
ncbi:MAG: methyltransferase domain-containing protein [Chloroflexi bacterium]|nr:methyltransferase domain-containing protein [Chloroflexota bacterium]